MRSDLPSGTVTFLFTDVEGSTRLLEELGEEGYEEALTQHRRVVRAACSAHGGVEVDTQGDAFFFAFSSPSGAVAAASELTRALEAGRIRVRVGLHTGRPRLGAEGYVGREVHVAARVAATGHGGQVVLSRATRDLVDGVELTELGEHRLKDVAEPVALFQLGDAGFPPLKTISNTNLPRPASSFVGRERELEEVTSLLRDGARLLTLTGPGGSGKTRLALEAATELLPEFKAGVFWVGLASLRDHSLVGEAIAQTLGAKEALAEHVGERELLLLLDNLEQVVECASELAALVEACPNLTLLVTSRELLRVRGEAEYVVPPLASPEAVALFCERSRLGPSEEVAELCARLDNLPLAVELAAARTRALTVSQILERLSQRLDLLKGGRDADPRQLTLRATIEWSYELLSPAEQQLFARLSVFAGGWTLEAAEQVAGADLDTLQSLVEKSLLRFTPSQSGGRYWMLETIREYGAEKLGGGADAVELRERHAGYFVRLAQDARAHVRHDSADWFDRLEAEHDNVRAALDHLETGGETQRALELAGAIWRFWFRRGHLHEGRRRIERMLAADRRPTPARAHALDGANVLAFNVGDASAARKWAEEAFELSCEVGDEWAIALSTLHLGGLYVSERDFASAISLLEESLARFETIGDDFYGLMAASNLAWAYEELGDRERARRQHEDVLARARAGNVEGQIVHSLLELAMLALRDGDADAAHAPLEESLHLSHRRRDLLYVAMNLLHVASALSLERRGREAAIVLAAGEAIRDRLEDKSRWLTEVAIETGERIRGQLGDVALAQAWAEGASMSTDAAVSFALAHLD